MNISLRKKKCPMKSEDVCRSDPRELELSVSKILEETTVNFEKGTIFYLCFVLFIWCILFYKFFAISTCSEYFL